MHTLQETFDQSNLAMIAQGRPGWNADRGRCSYVAGCAAAQLLTPEQRVICDDAADDCAASRPTCDFLTAAGHDASFVQVLQALHDSSAVCCKGNAERWRHVWLDGLKVAAARRGLSMDATLKAARDAGWANVPETLLFLAIGKGMSEGS